MGAFGTTRYPLTFELIWRCRGEINTTQVRIEHYGWIGLRNAFRVGSGKEKKDAAFRMYIHSSRPNEWLGRLVYRAKNERRRKKKDEFSPKRFSNRIELFSSWNLTAPVSLIQLKQAKFVISPLLFPMIRKGKTFLERSYPLSPCRSLFRFSFIHAW